MQHSAVGVLHFTTLASEDKEGEKNQIKKCNNFNLPNFPSSSPGKIHLVCFGSSPSDRGSNHAGEEVRAVSLSVVVVGEVRGRNDQCALADEISIGAEDLGS